MDDTYHLNSQAIFANFEQGQKMRVSQAEMNQNHQRIVKGASRLIRKQGIELTSVNDVMKKAGLTHGGFYRHFDSKESLVSAALENAFNEALDQIDKLYVAKGVRKGAEDYHTRYLSAGHLTHPELGCPIAALSMDVARSSESIKDIFTDNFNKIVEKLALAEEGNVADQRAAATQKICMLAGAIMIARALNSGTAPSVMNACKV